MPVPVERPSTLNYSPPPHTHTHARIHTHRFLDPTKRNDEDQRGNMADHLSEKYLSKKLDPMPSSTTISQYRKQISKIIEALGSQSGSNIGADWCDKHFETVKVSACVCMCVCVCVCGSTRV